MKGWPASLENPIQVPSECQPFFVCLSHSAFQNAHRNGQRLRIAKKRRKWMERGGWGRERKTTNIAYQQLSRPAVYKAVLLGEHPAWVRGCEDGSRSRSQAQVAAGRISQDRQGRWCHMGTLRRGRSELLLDRAPDLRVGTNSPSGC